MAIQRVRTLDSLYSEIVDYDLVIVPNNPLADALNRRVETPQFGTFATDPRRLATGRREESEDRTAFLSLTDRDHGWKALADAIGNVLQCWEHQGTAEAIREYPAFHDAATETVLETLPDLDTTSGDLTEYTTPADQSVAVLGFEQLTPLERSILSDADRVDLFAEVPFDLPQFHVFESPGAIVDALRQKIDPADAERVGIVLDRSSPYSHLVESALDAAGIPFYGGPGFVDDPDHRALLGLLRAAYRGSEITVADVRPVLSRLGIEVAIEHDAKRVDTVALPDLDWVTDFFEGVDSHTFESALAIYEEQAGRELEAFREELEQLGLLDTTLSAGRVQDVAYYLQTYEVPVDREDEGVLLADAKTAGYVDRPLDFFLGMGGGCTRRAPQRPWVDADALAERYLKQFQLLLQSGSEQYYLVQDTAGGEAVTPCLYFDELLETDVDRFSDFDSVPYTQISRTRGTGFAREALDAETEPLETVSQSSLNTFLNSPRDYLFTRLLDSPDRDYFREGTLFHDFAEFYATHPERVGEAELQAAVEYMLEETGAFYTREHRPVRRRKYRIGLETIGEFLDEYGPTDHDFLTPVSGWGENAFADLYDEPIDSPLTERWFENPAIGAKGLIDLVAAPDHLVDYKSGSKQSASKIRKQARIDPPNDTPNFQAALYLSHFRTVQPDQRIEFTFLYFLETLDDVVTGTADLAEALTTITYHPLPFEAFVKTRAAYDALLDGYNDCVETFADLGYAAYAEIMDLLAFPETREKAELRESEFAAEFTARVEARTNEDVDAEKGADQAIRELNGIRKRAFFEDDLASFEIFLESQREELNHYRAGEERFPIEGPGGEPNYRRVDHRDLLLEGL